MKALASLVLAIASTCPNAIRADAPPREVWPDQLISKPAYPVVRESGYVLLEIWPRVKDVTLSAFFFDDLDEKSRNLCESIKDALDRDAAVREREAGQKFTSYRMCKTVRDAARQGWIAARES